MRKTILQLYCILSLLLLGPADLLAQARYWVGGTGGNWSDPLKWSTVSGGAGGAGAPTVAQDALFDANSFTAPGGVVVVTGGATCRRMNWTGVTNGPVLSLSNPLTIDGNGNALVLADGMTVIGTADLILRGSGNITVNMGTTGKTVGAVKFTANAQKNITLATGDGLHTHSFGVITTGNNSTLNVTGNSTRIYAGMSTGGNAELITQGTSRFTGDVLIDGTVTASAGATLLLGAGAPINATFTGGGNNTFGNVIIGANASVTFSNNGNNAFGNVTTGSNATVAFPNSGNNTFGDFSINNSTTGTTSVTFSNQSNRFNAVTLNNTGTGTIRALFSNSVLSEYNTIAIHNNSTGSVLWQFTAAGTSSVTGSLTVNVACPATAITSSGATPATVNFSSTQVIAGASVSKLTATGAGLTVTNGLNGGGNTGVTFIKAPRAFYWRTNTGNWSDAGKWVVWNGTVFVPACSIPTNLDDVTFDNASFTTNTQRVILNVNGQCRSMQWLGIPLTRLPGFESPAANTLTLSGNLEFSPATVTTAFFGKVVFASAVPGRTINTAGKTLGNVDFNGPGGSWQLVGNALVSNGTVSLIAGTCDANGQAISANALNANGAGNLPRGLLLGSATHTLKGTGLVLDLRGNDNNFTLDPGTSTIQCIGNPGTAGLLTVETGTHPKTLPHLLFTGAGNHVLSTTGITTNRITFGDIHFSNVNGKNVNVLGDNPKTYGNIYFNGRDNIVAFNGTSNALPNGNTFGAVTFADGFSGAQATFRGNNVFNGAVAIHANGATAFANLINFTGTNAFKGPFTARLNNTAAAELQFASTGANTTAFYGAVSINPGHTKSDAVFYNATTFYPGANLSLGGATDAVFTGSGDNALQDVTVSAAPGTTTVTFTHNGNSTFRNVTLDATTPSYPSGGITWKFKAGGSVTATFSGNMNIKAACAAAVTIDSDAALQQARVAFTTPQTWNNNVTVRNINAVNASGSINAFQPGTNNINVFYPVSTANRTLYWVGGSGNWHDPFRWSTSSGGNPGACIPTANDNVLFDVNSGLGAGQVVSIAGGTAFCRSMDWTGIPASGTTLNLNADNLEINGSLTLAPGLVILPADPDTLSPTVIFTNSNTAGNVANAITKSVTNRTITLPGGTAASMPNVLFDDAAVTWALVGPAPFSVAYRLGLRAGTLQTNDVPVVCNNLTTNYWEDLPRTLNVTNSSVVITGSEATGLFPALDLTGNNLNFATPGAKARFQFTNSDLWIIIRTGDIAKELPDLLFESIPASLTAGPSNIDIFTHDGSSRITFRGIRITKANGSQLFVVGKCPKTYKGDLIFPDHFWDEPLESRSFDGSSAAEPNNNIFEGEVRFGNHCGVQFKGNNTFRKKVFFGAGAGSAAPTGSQTGVVFTEFNAFEDDVVIAGTADADDAIQFGGTNIFRPGAELTITATANEPTRGTPTVQFNNLGGTSSFYGHVNLQGNRSIYRFNGPARFFGADKKTTIGEQTRVWFIGGSSTTGSGEPVPGPGEYTFEGLLQLKAQSLARFRNDGNNRYNHVNMDGYSIFEFTALPARNSAVGGAFTLVGDCQVWTQVTSSFGGVTAHVSFAQSQAWPGTLVQDITRTGPGLVTVHSGIDQGNNNGIAFSGSNFAAGTLIWVGGNPLNISTNNHWSNPRNWATPPLDDIKRTYGGNCIPGSETNLVFNEESFSLSGTATKPDSDLATIFIDLLEVTCGDMVWADNVNLNTGTVRPGLAGGSANNQIEINGNLVLASPASMVNNFDGTFKFNRNATPGIRTIDTNGGDTGSTVTPFAGPVNFENVSGQWRLDSDIVIRANSSRGDFIITYGEVVANGRVVTLDGDWLIKRPLAGNPQGKFTAGTAGTVIFNGGNTGKAQMIVAATSPFWNVQIDRAQAGNPVDVTNDNSTVNASSPLNPASFVITLNKNESLPLEANAGTGTHFNAASNGLVIMNDLTIVRGHLWDYGYQLVGNTTGSGKLTIHDEGVLSIGNANGGNGSGPDNNRPVTTVFPTGYAGAGSSNLTLKSTVSYAANGHQDVSAGPQYGNLYLRNANCAEAGLPAIGSICQKKRIALGPLRMDGDLTVENGIHLIDNGFQITGNPAGMSRLTMGSGAILTLGSGNTAIATSTGAGADPANNLTGITPVTASASTFPRNIAPSNLNLDLNSVIIYQASVPQPVKGLSSAVPNQQYGHLVVQNAVPGATVAKLLDGPVQVRGSLVINPGSVLVDNGYQVSYTGPGGQTFRMVSSTASTGAGRVQDLGRQQADAFLTIPNVASGLVLGSQTSATTFPNYADSELDFDPNTTVTYNAGIAQAIRGLSDTGGLVAGQRQYANLLLINPISVSPALVSKTFTGPVVIRGNLTIYPNNNLVDGGNGMAGTGGQPFVMRSLAPAPNPVTGSGTTGTAGPSRLTLGTAAAATGFPTGYRTGNGTADSPSDIHFEPGTTVAYASGRPQSIQGLGGTGNTTYANLILANPAATPAATGLTGLVFPTVKTLVSRPTTVRGTLTIYPNNALFDNGWQLDGTAGGQFRMYSVTTANSETGGSGGQSRLVLGNGSVATHFPAGFRTGDGSAANPSDIHFEQNTAVVYNAGVDQPVQVLGTVAHTAYAELFLSNPVNVGASLVSKTLQATAGSGANGMTVRGAFTIGPNNHLVDNGFQLNGVAGRTFSMRNTTLAANPVRAFTTDPATTGTTGPSRLTVGTATRGTAFPTGYQTVNGTDITLEPNTTVVYNAGVDQPVQALITTGSLTANANYAHVVLANPSGSGFPAKTLTGGNVRIRGSLTIDANNSLDAGAGSGTIFLQGDWTSSGRFSARTGTVVMEGEATQTVVHSNTAAHEFAAAPEATQDFYHWTINKPAGEVLLKSRLAVSGTATFAKGLVHAGHLSGPALTVSPANVLIFRDNATAVGASNRSFVTGAVRKTGNDAFVFPVGAAGVTPPAYATPSIPEPNMYRPVGVSAPVSTATFIAQYYYGNPGDAGFDPARKQTEALNQSQPLVGVSVMEYWMLNREGPTATPGAADVFVTLSWHDPQSGVGTTTGTGTATPTDYQWLRVARWNGSTWQNMGGAGFGPDPIAGTTASNTGGTVTSEYNVNGTAGAVNHFSPFTLSSGMPNNSLPVTLVSFKGHLAEDHVLLNWQTASEVNTAQFVVERSRDAIYFTSVATVKAKGNHANVQLYQARDTNPLTGLSYYRLKIVDEDGRFKYAKTISISRYVADTGSTHLYPNPGEGRQLFVECTDPAAHVVAVHDLVGRKVLFTQTKLGSGKWEVTFGQGLQPGVYLVVVAGKTGSPPQRVRFVVR